MCSGYWSLLLWKKDQSQIYTWIMKKNRLTYDKVLKVREKNYLLRTVPVWQGWICEHRTSSCLCSVAGMVA